MLQAIIIVLLLIYIAYYYVAMRNVVTKHGENNTPAQLLNIDNPDISSGVVIQLVTQEPTFFPNGYSIIIKIPKPVL